MSTDKLKDLMTLSHDLRCLLMSIHTKQNTIEDLSLAIQSCTQELSQIAQSLNL